MGNGVLVREHAAVWTRGQRASAVAWTAALACAVIWGVIAWQLVFPAPNRMPLGWGTWTLAFSAIGFLSLSLSAAGAVIVMRRPGNAVGWLNVVGGVALTLPSLGLIIGSQQLGNPGAPFAVTLVAFVSASALQASVAFFGLGFLWFPDGPRAAGRLRWVAALIPIAVLTRFLELFFQKGADWLLPFYPSTAAPANPFEAQGALGAVWDFDHSIAIGWWLSGTCVVLSAIAMGTRFWRARGTERVQLLWFTAAVVLITPTTIAFIYVLLALPPATSQADGLLALFFLGLALPTLATLVAITRYRLYEIDRIVNRAIVYGAVTTILAGLFAGLITVSQQLFSAIAGTSSDAAIALTAVVVTVAYTPVRGWVQQIVDRRIRFVDPRFGPYRDALQNALEMFDPRRAASRLVREAAGQMHAEAGAAFLDLDGELHLVATVGSWKDATAAIVIPIGTGHNRIGELHLSARDGDQPYSSADSQALTSVADLAAQAIIAAETAAIGEQGQRLRVGGRAAPP